MSDRKPPNPPVWMNSGNEFRHAHLLPNSEKLPPGLYEFNQSMTGWWLQRIGDKFHFPWKVYGSHDPKVNRIIETWKQCNNGESFGALMNGLQGSGKSVTIKQVANRLIGIGAVVIIVKDPIPVAMVSSTLEQDVVFIFDEFEKTHNNSSSGDKANPQQTLLSTIDGMNTSRFRRFYLFATNIANIEANFKNRPSRIRYTWTFGNLTKDVLEEILDDLLHKDLKHLREETLEFLLSCDLITMDSVKSVIEEVNRHKQGPEEFAEFFNLTRNTDLCYTIKSVNDQGNRFLVFQHFTVSNPSPESVQTFRKALRGVTGKELRPESLECTFNSSFGDVVKIFAGTAEQNVVIGGLKVSPDMIWMADFPQLLKRVTARLGYYGKLWLDKKPESWAIPDWVYVFEQQEAITQAVGKLTEASPKEEVEAVRARQKHLDKAKDSCNVFLYPGSVYGTKIDGATSEELELIRLEFTKSKPYYKPPSIGEYMAPKHPDKDSVAF